jgi:CDP-6-deoxy-D-xylo-4-hexulose-3-dehydrase
VMTKTSSIQGDAFYPLASSSWGEEEVAAINRVVKSGRHTMGDEVAQYENEFANLFNSQFAVMSNSGSSANLLAISALRYTSDFNPERNEIIVPAVSWGTTYYPIHQAGYKLRFVDVDLDTLNASAAAVEEAINAKTVGIFAVSILGNPADLRAYQDLAKKYELFLLEDNCESMGAKIGSRHTGTFGSVGTFSSYFSHHISTIEGGVCLTDSREIYEHMYSLRAHGWVRGLPTENTVYRKSGDEFEDSFRFALPGWNLRPIEIEGAIGREQLRKFSQIIAARKRNALLFQAAMIGVEGYSIQKEIYGESSWFGFSLIMHGKLTGKRRELVEKLRDAGIESRPIVAGNFTRNPVIQLLNHAPIGELPNSNAIHSQGLFIGNHAFDLVDQIGRATEILSSFSKRF